MSLYEQWMVVAVSLDVRRGNEEQYGRCASFLDVLCYEHIDVMRCTCP